MDRITVLPTEDFRAEILLNGQRMSDYEDFELMCAAIQKIVNAAMNIGQVA